MREKDNLREDSPPGMPPGAVTAAFRTAKDGVGQTEVDIAHHADVGGLTPGSMPPQSKTLAEEGVFRVGMTYTLNFFWVTFAGKPATHEHTDIRH